MEYIHGDIRRGHRYPLIDGSNCPGYYIMLGCCVFHMMLNLSVIVQGITVQLQPVAFAFWACG